MSDEIDAILRRVASGDLTPEQALPLIDAAQRARAGDPPTGQTWGTPPPGPIGNPGAPETPPAAGADTVRIWANYRSLDVIADPSITEVAASGLHSVRREGTTLIVESLQLPGFAEPWGAEGGSRGGRFAFATLPRSIAWARAMKDQHVTVRVNPSLAIELDAAASSVRLSGCEGGVKLHCVAASVKLDRLRGPLEVDAMSSSVKGSTAITGSSRITAESSSVKLVLLPGTDVTVVANNRLGKVVLPTGVSKAGWTDGRSSQAVLGDGTGRLTIDAVMSSVLLTTDSGVRVGR